MPATHMSVELPTTLGLDLSDLISTFHVQRGDGQTVSTGKVATTRAALTGLFQKWTGCRLVIEAGTHSPWISRLGQECGMEVVVANPRRVELISKNERKTDRADAEILADLGRTSVKRLSPITHRSKQAQSDLALQRARGALVSCRTGLINHVRGVLKSHGYRPPSCSADCFARRAGQSMPAELEPALGPLLLLLESLRAQIKQYEGLLDNLERTQPTKQLLQKIPGIGPISAVTFALTLDDPTRFTHARQVGAYLGMVPRKKDSGTSSPQLHITKAGDRELRRLLVLAAHYVLGRFGPDCDLRRFGLRIAGSAGNKIAKKRAVVAVARKLSVLMYHLWVTGEEYDPFYLAKKRGDPVPA
jgi:transposase